jgi:hypothetical protein
MPAAIRETVPEATQTTKSDRLRHEATREVK